MPHYHAPTTHLAASRELHVPLASPDLCRTDLFLHRVTATPSQGARSVVYYICQRITTKRKPTYQQGTVCQNLNVILLALPL